MVVDAETLAASDYVLETRLDHFYVDLRPDVERASVVAFTATLLRSGREKSAPVLMRSYEEREPVEERGPTPMRLPGRSRSSGRFPGSRPTSR